MTDKPPRTDTPTPPSPRPPGQSAKPSPELRQWLDAIRAQKQAKQDAEQPAEHRAENASGRAREKEAKTEHTAHGHDPAEQTRLRGATTPSQRAEAPARNDPADEQPRLRPPTHVSSRPDQPTTTDAEPRTAQFPRAQTGKPDGHEGGPDHARPDERVTHSDGPRATTDTPYCANERPGNPDVAENMVPEINIGKQGKHIVGHNNFITGRSELAADPNALAVRAGSGGPVGSVPRGRPGFRERVDFGEEIGTYVGTAGDRAPTTVGIIHYSSDGAIHIVPARPLS